VLIPGERRWKEKEKLFPLGSQVCPSKNDLREKANKKIKGKEKGHGKVAQSGFGDLFDFRPGSLWFRQQFHGGTGHN